MNAFARALSAELLKTKRTLALLMTVLAPAIIAVILFAMYLQGRDFHLAQTDRNPWLSLHQNGLLFWALLMLPLFVTLETALLSGLEYERKNWTLLYTMPLPRWAFYAAKQVISLSLVALSNAVMFGFVVLVGLLLQQIEPGYRLYADVIPWALMLKGYGVLYLAALLIISVHVWVSSRWPGYVVPFAAGIAATVAGVLVFESELARFFPWSMPGLLALSTVNDIQPALSVPVFLAVGVGGGLLVALAGGWHIGRRDAL